MESVARSANGFLASLSMDDFEAIRPHLRTVHLLQDRVLFQAGEPNPRVYLPHSCVVSLVVELETGGRIDVGLVGRDSIVGALAGLGDPISLTGAVVLLAGDASVLDVNLLRAAAEQSRALRAALARHGQGLVAQAQRTAVCNVAHSVEARLARWLLQVRDLAGSDQFTLTQELMAELIGARRNSVSIVAHMLQQARYIRYSRGRVVIVDLGGLTRTACECHARLRSQHEKLRLIQVAADHPGIQVSPPAHRT
jgi:CRP-like cAMP-binding protein